MSLPDRITVVTGDIVTGLDCNRCGNWHPILDGSVNCCCGDPHDPHFCCGCGHFHIHISSTCPQAPCGDYRCCIN